MMRIARHGDVEYRFAVQECELSVIDEVVTEDCYDVEAVPKGSFVIDVGANIGAFSLMCAAERGCRVLAIEPARQNFELLEANIEANEHVEQIDTIRAAISDHAGVEWFFSRTDHPAGSMLSSLFPSPEIRRGNEELVPCFRLEDLTRRPFVLKLDCEGAEVLIFKSLSTWAHFAERIVMEWHNHDGWRFEEMLREHGFEVFLCGGGPPPRPTYDRSIGGGLLYAWRKA